MGPSHVGLDHKHCAFLSSTGRGGRKREQRQSISEPGPLRGIISGYTRIPADQMKVLYETHSRGSLYTHELYSHTQIRAVRRILIAHPGMRMPAAGRLESTWEWGCPTRQRMSSPG